MPAQLQPTPPSTNPPGTELPTATELLSHGTPHPTELPRPKSRGLLPPSTRVAPSMAPGSPPGEVQWWRSARCAPPRLPPPCGEGTRVGVGHHLRACHPPSQPPPQGGRCRPWLQDASPPTNAIPTSPHPHGTSPAAEPGPIAPSTRVAPSMAPGSPPGEVQWWGGLGARPHVSLPLVGREQGWGWATTSAPATPLPTSPARGEVPTVVAGRIMANKLDPNTSPPARNFPGRRAGAYCPLHPSGAIHGPRVSARGSPAVAERSVRATTSPSPLWGGNKGGGGPPPPCLPSPLPTSPARGEVPTVVAGHITANKRDRNTSPPPRNFPGRRAGPIAPLHPSGAIHCPRVSARGSSVVGESIVIAGHITANKLDPHLPPCGGGWEGGEPQAQPHHFPRSSSRIPRSFSRQNCVYPPDLTARATS